jgi:exodeoxyribonuclease V alpha subunit
MLDGMVNLERVHGAKVKKGVSGSTREIMKAEPNPSHWEVLAGMVERVTYQNVENGFCVIRVKVRGHRELATVVGHAAAISAGEWVTATGQQFKTRFLKTSAPTSIEGIEGILRRG